MRRFTALAEKTATSPERIASCFFRSLGRTIVHDQGYFPIALKFVLKVLVHVKLQKQLLDSAEHELVFRGEVELVHLLRIRRPYTQRCLQILDFNFMAWLISRTASTTADYIKSKKARGTAAAGVEDTAASTSRKASVSPARKRRPVKD